MNRTHKFRQGMLLALAMFTAVLVFAAPQRCADALHAGLVLCGGPLLVSLFPFLIVSALLMGCGAGPLLGFAFQPAAWVIGVRAKAAGSVLLVGSLGGFAPAAAAAAQAVRTGQLTPRQASALLPACVCLPAKTEDILLPTLDAVVAQAAVTYLKLCGFVLYFRMLAAGVEALLPKPWTVLPAMLLEVCSGCDCASRTGLWASTLCCAALSVQGASVLLQVRTICPPEVSLGPLLAARVLHLPLSLALFWLVVPGTEQAVQAFSTLSGRVVVMHRVPLDCALLAFAVCCITVAELQKRCSGQCEALHDQHKKTAAR